MFAMLQVGTGGQSIFIIAAAVIGGYMALNIGANDVANNVGPAIGARALTMTGALVIAAVCEAAGAILAGGDVVATVSKGRSEEHTSELQSLMRISYAVFCLKKKNN